MAIKELRTGQVIEACGMPRDRLEAGTHRIPTVRGACHAARTLIRTEHYWASLRRHPAAPQRPRGQAGPIPATPYSARCPRLVAARRSIPSVQEVVADQPSTVCAALVSAT